MRIREKLVCPLLNNTKFPLPPSPQKFMKISTQPPPRWDKTGYMYQIRDETRLPFDETDWLHAISIMECNHLPLGLSYKKKSLLPAEHLKTTYLWLHMYPEEIVARYIAPHGYFVISDIIRFGIP